MRGGRAGGVASRHCLDAFRLHETRRPKAPKLSTQCLRLSSNAPIKTRNPSLCSDRSAPIVPSHCQSQLRPIAMPKGSTSVRGRKRATQDYEDDGFVVTDDSAPKSKKAKKGQSAGKQQDDEGNEFWEVSLPNASARRFHADPRAHR